MMVDILATFVSFAASVCFSPSSQGILLGGELALFLRKHFVERQD